MTALPCSYRFDHMVYPVDDGSARAQCEPKNADSTRRCWADSEAVALRAGMLNAGCSATLVNDNNDTAGTLRMHDGEHEPRVEPQADDGERASSDEDLRVGRGLRARQNRVNSRL